MFLNCESKSTSSCTGTPMTQFKRFPECFNNNQQSPIDITGSIKSDSDAKLILSDSWWTPRSKEILLNTGHKRKKKLIPTIVILK